MSHLVLQRPLVERRWRPFDLERVKVQLMASARQSSVWQKEVCLDGKLKAAIDR